MQQSIAIGETSLDSRAASGQQIPDDQDDHDCKQYVNEASSEMQQEADQPQGKQNNDNGPKQASHITNLLTRRTC
jgi:hypothetical protein